MRILYTHPQPALSKLIIIKHTIFAADAFVSIRARAVEGVHFIVTSSAIHTRVTVAFIDFCKYSNNMLPPLQKRWFCYI